MQAYYPQLEKIVLANLSTNISDLVEVDCDSLTGYQGAFLHAHSHDSTHLILLDDPRYLNWQACDQAEGDFFRNANSSYIFGCNGSLRQISKARAMQIWLDYTEHLHYSRKASTPNSTNMQQAS